MSILGILFGTQKRIVRRRIYIRPPRMKFISGETHYYKGRAYVLNVMQAKGRPKVELVHDGRMDLYVSDKSSVEQRERLLREWYRKQLKTQLIPIIDKWQNIIGVKVHEHNVKYMRTRWGTCNVKAKRIWLSLELAKKPEHCLEYVVVHELVHLLEKKHDARFKAYMDSFVPNWRDIRKELSNR